MATGAANADTVTIQVKGSTAPERSSTRETSAPTATKATLKNP